MSADTRELLPLYALGILDADETRLVERALEEDSELAAELASYRHTTDALIEQELSAVEPVAPSASVQARLLASVGGGRYESFSARLSKLFDVTVDRARELLGLMERPESWDAFRPGVGLIHFEGGPAVAGADCGFVRLQPGAVFPFHDHRGEEVSVVLMGELKDLRDGQTYGPGDEVVVKTGREHAITTAGEVEVVFAARALNGITIDGKPL